MAAETTKFQVNFKTHRDGTLINLYADSIKDLETQINDLSMIAALIKSTEKELETGAGSFAPSAPLSPEQVAASLSTAPESGDTDTVADKYGNTWVYNLPNAPECGRGKMVLKHGKAQATGKPYKGFFDPASGPKWTGPKVPKEQQAATIWA
jgi:hypothetical protein